MVSGDTVHQLKTSESVLNMLLHMVFPNAHGYHTYDMIVDGTTYQDEGVIQY